MSGRVELELIAKTEEAIKNLQKAQSSIEGIGQGGIKATDDLRSIGGDMKGLAKDLAGDFAKVAGVVTGSAALVKKAMDFGAEAATIDQTAQSFDGLIQRARVSTDLLEQLDAAALGTVDDMTLMSSTLTLVAGTSGELQQELLEATPQLMEIAKAANKLNPTLGDTAHMYESLATGIKRASPMILDNLGLTIKVGEANEQYAASIGKTVEELSAEEKQLALLSAALTAGDTLIAQVGGTTDSSADSFAAMEANIKNAGDALKMEFLPILSDAATGLNTMLSSLGLTDTVQQHAEDVSKTAGSYEEYAAEIERAANAAGMYVNNTGDLINMHGAMVEKGYQLSQAEFEAAQGMAALEAQAKQTAEATSENLQRMKKEGLDPAGRTVGDILGGLQPVSYTHLTLPTN